VEQWRIGGLEENMGKCEIKRLGWVEGGSASFGEGVSQKIGSLGK
jgi:hypothetical protein